MTHSQLKEEMQTDEVGVFIYSLWYEQKITYRHMVELWEWYRAHGIIR